MKKRFFIYTITANFLYIYIYIFCPNLSILPNFEPSVSIRRIRIPLQEVVNPEVDALIQKLSSENAQVYSEAQIDLFLLGDKAIPTIVIRFKDRTLDYKVRDRLVPVLFAIGQDFSDLITDKFLSVLDLFSSKPQLHPSELHIISSAIRVVRQLANPQATSFLMEKIAEIIHQDIKEMFADAVYEIILEQDTAFSDEEIFVNTFDALTGLIRGEYGYQGLQDNDLRIASPEDFDFARTIQDLKGGKLLVHISSMSNWERKIKRNGLLPPSMTGNSAYGGTPDESISENVYFSNDLRVGWRNSAVTLIYNAPRHLFETALVQARQREKVAVILTEVKDTENLYPDEDLGYFLCAGRLLGFLTGKLWEGGRKPTFEEFREYVNKSTEDGEWPPYPDEELMDMYEYFNKNGPGSIDFRNPEHSLRFAKLIAHKGPVLPQNIRKVLLVDRRTLEELATSQFDTDRLSMTPASFIRQLYELFIQNQLAPVQEITDYLGYLVQVAKTTSCRLVINLIVSYLPYLKSEQRRAIEMALAQNPYKGG